LTSVADYERLRLDKVAAVLAEGQEPHLMNGEQYKKSLRDGRRVVTSTGEEVEDVGAHPDTRAVNTIARVLDRQFDPATRDALTYVDEDGARRAVGWQVPTTREHLWAKRESTRIITLETLGCTAARRTTGP